MIYSGTIIVETTPYSGDFYKGPEELERNVPFASVGNASVADDMVEILRALGHTVEVRDFEE